MPASRQNRRTPVAARPPRPSSDDRPRSLVVGARSAKLRPFPPPLRLQSNLPPARRGIPSRLPSIPAVVPGLFVPAIGPAVRRAAVALSFHSACPICSGSSGSNRTPLFQRHRPHARDGAADDPDGRRRDGCVAHGADRMADLGAEQPRLYDWNVSTAIHFRGWRERASDPVFDSGFVLWQHMGKDRGRVWSSAKTPQGRPPGLSAELSDQDFSGELRSGLEPLTDYVLGFLMAASVLPNNGYQTNDIRNPTLRGEETYRSRKAYRIDGRTFCRPARRPCVDRPGRPHGLAHRGFECHRQSRGRDGLPIAFRHGANRLSPVDHADARSQAVLQSGSVAV